MFELRDEPAMVMKRTYILVLNGRAMRSSFEYPDHIMDLRAFLHNIGVRVKKQ